MPKVFGKIRFMFLSRRKKLKIVQELRQIRRSLCVSGTDVVFLHRRFDKLMMSIRGQTNMSWLRVCGVSEAVASECLKEIVVREKTAYTELDAAIQNRQSELPPHKEWNQIAFIRIEKKRIKDFYDWISRFNDEVGWHSSPQTHLTD